MKNLHEDSLFTSPLEDPEEFFIRFVPEFAIDSLNLKVTIGHLNPTKQTVFERKFPDASWSILKPLKRRSYGKCRMPIS